MSNIADLLNRKYRDELTNPSINETFYGLTTDDSSAVSYHDIINNANKSKQEHLRVTAFRERYIKIRTDNIALTHEHAIELVKMIEREASLITYEDTQ